MANFTGTGGDDIFTGGIEADTASGGGGNDSLSGGDNNDILAGDAGSDTLEGGEGEDRLYSASISPPFSLPYYNNPYTPPVLDTGSEVDTLIGGAGSDSLFAGYGDHVDGGTGGSYGNYLYISFLGAPSGVTADFRLVSQTIGGGTITGMENISWVQGSNFDDDINVGSYSNNGYSNFTAVFAMGGNDRLVAGYYTGVLDGGDGDDIVDGRPSQYQQAVYGGAGNDILYTPTNSFASAHGGDGNDTIYSHGATYGGAGNDLIILSFSYYGGQVFGEDGDDEIRASNAGHTMSGGAGADILLGNSANDYLYSAGMTNGVPDDDVGLERDTIDGAGGNDTISAGYGDNIDGGTGTDTLRLSLAGATGGVTLNTAGIVAGTPFAFAGGTIQNIETLTYLRGSSFADTLTIVTQSQLLTLDAGDGDDIVTTGSSSVAVTGGNGNDRFISGAAADTYDGGAGTDTIDYANSAAGVTVTLALSAGGISSGPGGDTLRNIENIAGSAFADTLNGNNFDNFIQGMGGNDTLTGLGGNDTLDGGAGDDLVDGGAGADSLSGGLGDDVYYVDDAGDTITELAGEGSDEVRTAMASLSIAAFANVEMLTGTGNVDQSLTGNGGDNVIDGGLGADAMAGGDGNDSYVVDNVGDTVTELAGEGVDEIRTGLSAYSLQGLANVENLTATSNVNHDFRGNSGDNVITGAGGNDTLRLQDGGNDLASGGAGNDFFLLGTTLNALDGIDGGAGTDQLAIQGNYTLTLGSGLVNVESLIPLPGNDVRFGDSGTNFYSYVLTTVDANVAAGQRLTVDANRLRAGEDFTFNGAAETDGNFFLIGGNGVDTLTGGAQSDTFLFGENGQFGASDTVNGGPGGTNDQLGLRGNYTITFGANQLVSIESIALVSSQDTRFGPLGSVFSYNLTMNDGNVAAGQLFTVDAAPLRSGETLTFSGAAELNGSYRVAGGAGNDSIIGGEQGDILIGRGGADTMKGGGGADVFRYNAVSDSTGIGFDTLVEFNFQADRIDLPVAVTGWTASLRGALNSATFDADIAAAIDAGLNPHSAVMFSPDSGDFSGRSFAIVDADGDGSYQAGQDYVFEVTPNAFPFDPVTPNVFI